jgi:hypothetical protein
MVQAGFRLAAILVSLLPLGFLASCAPPTVAAGMPGVAQLDMMTVVGTDKTILDHVVSYSSGKDCSYVNVEKGNEYCKEDERVIKPQVYCHNTLGSVTCYERPDPYGNGERVNGNNEHNMVTTQKSR